MSNEPHFITVVLGIPINQRGEVLLTQRNAPTKPVIHQKWQLAGGGVEFGEQPIETLKRELREELSAECEVLFPYPIVAANGWPAEPGGHDHATHVTLIGYLVSVRAEQPLHILDEETLSAKWFTWEETKELEMLPGTAEFLAEAEQAVKNFTLI